MYSDSQSAIHSTKNQMVYERAKHIDVFIRDVIAQGAIVLKKNPYNNPVDMMTKFVPMIKFKHCLDLIGVSNI